MPNRDTEALLHYHEVTKHSYQSVRANRHHLDFDNYPLPFKIYSGVELIPLPRDWAESEIDALSAVSDSDLLIKSKPTAIDLKTLASFLFHTAGITRHRSHPSGEMYFRAAACTGALYEIELYVVCGRLPDLEAGLYHFDPAEFALGRLRSGDFRPALASATAEESSVVHAPATIICTGTYWRNAWKYQARTYRHFFWDNGTLLANLFAITAAIHIPAHVVMGFVDDDVNRLLSLNTDREVSLSIISLGRSTDAVTKQSVLIDRLNYETHPYSKKEIDYPLMRQSHAASSLSARDEVKQWRGHAPAVLEPAPSGPVMNLRLLESDWPQDHIEQVILRRGSSRRFGRTSISFEQLSILLMSSTQGISADFLEPFGTRLNDLYLIVNAVTGLLPGKYYLRRDGQGLELIKEGSFRAEAGHLGLDQDLPADASVAIFFMADLQAILARFGNRGYRAAQIEAGIIGGKIYLGAYAQRLGATGLTFYDDEVTEFFSPHAASKSTIFLTAVGVPARRQFPVL